MGPRRSRYAFDIICVQSLSSLPLTSRGQGSVFTEFVEYKSVEAFLNADPKPAWDGKELLIMSKEAYVEMKIKEKGLKGKAAIVKRDHITRKGFDAFREMQLAAEGKDPKSGKKDAEKTKPAIFVEFLGAKLRVLEEDGGSVAAEDVPRVRGSALRFVGCGGEVSFDEIKRPLKERFARAPFVKFTKGDDAGLVGFDKALDDDDTAFIREKIPTLNGKPITWDLPEGMHALGPLPVGVGSAYFFSVIPAEQEEHAFGIERANASAKRALGGTEGTRGGRGAAEVPEEEVGAVGAVGETAEVEEIKRGTARRMAGTNKRARNGRGLLSRTAATSPGRAGKRCPPSCRPLHQKSQRRTAESREYGSWQALH